MKNEYIKFSSITTAQKAQRILSENGIRSSIGKNPDPKQTEGCGYALFLSDTAFADDILKKYGVTSKGIGKVKN